MKRRIALILSGIAIVLMGSASVISDQNRLIWNRTESAPVGLYWRSDGPLTLNGWAVVSARSEAAKWASAHGFTGADWPLIKLIRGLPGDEICRENEAVSINQNLVAEALIQASSGLDLPRWQGCYVLQEGEVFLLNEHPQSLDGRYFGVMKESDLDGVAILLWRLR
ncbi:S26 family signal peptidase [Parvularcula lutaonensis]|uniref:S26 family signal peptidase n=1 Tax=Parvularcula lutaonensis TaxID=491923 RepID=A0ABV7MAW1_9PROT|nr:S26 family signal peptidase [Parvularcula lutaonensis]